MKLTLEFGIDLGTTNSAIAQCTSDKPTLIPDKSGETIMPSVIHIAEDGSILTGRAAQAQLNNDPENTKAEFKRLMGTKEKYHFPKSDQSFFPEELAGIILKELVGRVHNETVQAAVITIPAMFQLPQSDATRRAAQKVGIEHAILLQEPIAAAVAHASSTLKNEGSWLIYDLGGGTFDVSLVRSKAGRLQVIDHNGDNQLGGKDLDRLVVNEIARSIREHYKLENFQRSNSVFREFFTELKYSAEIARINLSQQEQTLIKINVSGFSDDEFFEMPLDRGHLEQIIEPTILRSIKLCKHVLDKNKLKSTELNGIVLVGGPTLTPCLPIVLERELSIEARHVMNPISIVAYGAAVYASTQKLPEHLRKRKESEASPHSEALPVITLDLSYEPMTTNPNPIVVGRLLGLSTNSNTPKYVRIKRLDEGFDTDRIPLTQADRFLINLKLISNTLNAFAIELTGETVVERFEASPAEFTILHGLSVSQPPLSQSVGIMLANNSMAWYIRKGASLPAEKTLTLYTSITLKEGQSGEAVHVPLVQGENERADRNKVIGILKIYAEHIRHDLPVGSEVQITLAIDAFSQTVARAYVPMLDQWFEDIIRFDIEIKEASEIADTLTQQTNRLVELEAMAAQLEQPIANHGEINEIPQDQHERISQIEELLNEGDTDSKLIAEKLIREFTEDMDGREDADQLQKLGLKYKGQIELMNEQLKGVMSGKEKSEAHALQKEYDAAMKQGEIEIAQEKLDHLERLNHDAYSRTDDYIKGIFAALYHQFQTSTDSRIQSLLIKGATEWNRDNVEGLKIICYSLIQYLPENTFGLEEKELKNILSHVHL